jgi:cytochrome P450 family 142 subfamily A polypeptide 1
MAPEIGRICDELIDAVCERGECDFVDDLAAALPLVVIADMVGIPPADRGNALMWSDAMLASLSGGPGSLQRAAEAFSAFSEYATQLVAARRREPTSDLVTVLAHAEVEGDRLADDEIIFETLLLLVGGDETTRHVLTGGMHELQRHPDQHARLVTDRELLPIAVEEMLRWVSPIKSMARTVTQDLEMRGKHLHQGDKVLLLYESANFDDAQFSAPDSFDTGRIPNDHVAFGFGPHYCLGASLARLEITTMLDRLLTRLPDLEPAGHATREFTTITHMPMRFTPVRRAL